MPINYIDVTKIQNGQAISADVLNVPSVDLETRTDEVLRNTQYEDYLLQHGTDSLVRLTPTLDTNAVPNLTINSELKSDGLNPSTNLRFYSVDLDNCVLSVYAKSVPGSRFIIDGTAISNFFSDSADNQVESNHLHVTGDGVYLKYRTKKFDGNDSGSYAETASQLSKAASISNNFVLNPNISIDQADLVKLPERSLITLVFNPAITAQEFINHLNGADGYSGYNITASLDANNNLSIVDDNSNIGTLRVSGVQGADCLISKVYNDSLNNLVLEVTPDTCAIYTENDKQPATSLQFLLNINADNSITETNTIIDGNTGFKVTPKLLDPDFMYIPLIRLLETELLVGDKSFSLIRDIVQDGNTAAEDTFGLANFYGAPIEFLDQSTTPGTKSLVFNLLLPKGVNTLPGKRVVQGLFTASNGSIICNLSKTSAFQEIIAALSLGREVVFTGGIIEVVNTLTLGNTTLIDVTCTTTFNHTGGANTLSSTIISNLVGLFEEFSTYSFTPEAADTNSYQVLNASQVPLNTSTCVLSLVPRDSNDGIISGTVHVELSFFVK
jgi:hypothetical protein